MIPQNWQLLNHKFNVLMFGLSAEILISIVVSFTFNDFLTLLEMFWLHVALRAKKKKKEAEGKMDRSSPM